MSTLAVRMEEVRRETLELAKRMLTHVGQRIEESKAHLRLREDASKTAAPADYNTRPDG